MPDTERSPDSGSRQRRVSSLANLAGRTSLPDMTADDLAEFLKFRKVHQAIRVRTRFRWPWGAGAEYLYRELIRALGLQEHEDELVQLAKPKRGRKEQRELAERIYRLQGEGKTVRETREILVREGFPICSIEAIESYRKSRRRNKPHY